jgi:hypothetical protein
MDVEAGAGASWSGVEWEPVDAAAGRVELEVLRAERALASGYPALARVLGAREIEALARELVASHPFLPGSNTELPELLRAFLGAALEDDRRRGAWLAELARLEEAVAAVRRTEPVADELAGAQLLACEHRVDELRDQLLTGGPWGEPAPQPVLLAVVGGPKGPRCVELSREDWSTAVTLGAAGTLGRLPHRSPGKLAERTPRTPPSHSAA